MFLTAPVFLTAQWRDLVLLNYRVPAELLAPWTPPGTELDDFHGQTLASIVGFHFERTRVLGVPAWFHRRFAEINLRFYVRRKFDGQWRRGVVFVRELVNRPLVAWVARWFYNEKYLTVPLRGHVEPLANSSGKQIEYQWREAGRPRGVRAVVDGPLTTPLPGSLEQFILEHYWGYGVARSGATIEYRVEHPPWQVWKDCAAEWIGDAAAVYGRDWADILAQPPHSTLATPGSAVVVRRPRWL